MNMIEPDAAVQMGIGRNNPVNIYATIGMTSLLIASFLGEIPEYQIDVELADDFWPVTPHPGSTTASNAYRSDHTDPRFLVPARAEGAMS